MYPSRYIVSFRTGKELIYSFFFVLYKRYNGTHKFHNFTSGKKATDASSSR